MTQAMVADTYVLPYLILTTLNLRVKKEGFIEMMEV